MEIYNTLTKKVDTFTPNESSIVRIYSCGPTLYDYTELSSLRTYILEDILEKGLEYIGYDVLRVMNIDDIENLKHHSKEFQERNKNVNDITNFYERVFYVDFAKLNIRKPKVVERSSSHIDIYIEMIKKLIDQGYTYTTNGNIYFDTSKVSNYYQLVGENQELDEPLDLSKKNKNDFVLWYTNGEVEINWDSPWGKGYPGSYIECAGIAYKYLGEYLDIHCGGIDDIYPHHTNELAETEAFIGHKWCNYWIHCRKVNTSEYEVTPTLGILEDKDYNPFVYRYFCLKNNYKKQIDFTYDKLNVCQQEYNEIKSKIRQLNKTPNLLEDTIDNYLNSFKSAIANDLDTEQMLIILDNVLDDKQLTDYTKLYLIEDFDKVLSLNLIDENKDTLINDDTELLIQNKIKARKEAKDNNDYFTANRIEDDLLNKGIRLVDTKDGTTFEIIKE